VLEEKKNNIVRDVGYFKTLTLPEQNDVLQQYGIEIGAAFAKTVSTHFGLMHNFWNSVPENVRPYLPYDVIDATSTYYANIVNNSPANKESLLQKIPPDILPFVFTKIASRKNWYKKAVIKDLPTTYESYGHSDYETMETSEEYPNYMWVLYGQDIIVKEETGDKPVHSDAFSFLENMGVRMENIFRGRFDSSKNVVTILKPVYGANALRDIPSVIMNKLRSKFGPDINIMEF
ncbi:MAG TPA: hypothetical protein VMZ91_15220, partial [Candidatus Paceibacterota bacterium]|nr:hypothetical protein [Candidatus Paceibacterota bacterium]